MWSKLFFFIVFLCAGFIHAQSTYTVSGIVNDEEGLPIPGARVILKKDTSIVKIVLTDFDGVFSISTSSGDYTLNIESMGYKNTSQKVALYKNIVLNINSKPDYILTQEVVIETAPKDVNVSSTSMGKVALTSEEIKKLPALMGEVDLMKSIQLLPGVLSSGEGTSGLYVRGGGPDQNLVLLDEATLYNTGHLFGFFSVFNADAIEDVTLYKGSIPAQYGGRLSSVLDFKGKSATTNKLKASGGIGIISSRLTLEGAIKKDTTHFLVSARRTYVDILTKPLIESNGNRGIPYYFYDLNTKLSHKINSKNKLFFSAYHGRDDVSFNLLDGRFKAAINWGNSTSTLRWQHTFNDSLFLNSYVVFNNYQFAADVNFDNISTVIQSDITDFGVKEKLHFIPNKRHELLANFEYTYHTFTPRSLEAETNDEQSTDLTSDIQNFKKYAQEIALSFDDSYTISNKWKADIGLRGSVYQQLGPYEYIQKEDRIIDTTNYSRFESVKNYFGLEPRAAIRYSLDSSSSLKASYVFSNQYAHLLSLSGNALPFDIWVPSSVLLKPQRGVQYSVGYFKNLKENKFETSVEVYYRDMWNQIEYRQDFIPTLTGELERDLVIGTGKSYGSEFFVKKKLGKLTGWIGYTISKTTREFDQINDGRIFPAKYDRRHDLSVVGTYELNKRWTFSGSFVYGTGQAITLAVGRYLIENKVVNVYGDRNSFRMPAYHRLDISATLNSKKTTRFESYWVFSVYNLYNRKNPYIIYTDTEGNVNTGEARVVARQFYVFPVLPSVTWNFKF